MTLDRNPDMINGQNMCPPMVVGADLLKMGDHGWDVAVFWHCSGCKYIRHMIFLLICIPQECWEFELLRSWIGLLLKPICGAENWGVHCELMLSLKYAAWATGVLVILTKIWSKAQERAILLIDWALMLGGHCTQGVPGVGAGFHFSICHTYLLCWS